MTRATILVVDDEPRLRRVLELVLTDAGYAVESAATAREGLDALSRTAVQLALVDLMLPDGSGLELLERIRETTPDLLVIVMTAYGTVETAVRAMKLGAIDYLVKPFDVELIETTVARALELQAARRENAYLRAVTDEPFEGTARPERETTVICPEPSSML